MSEQNKPTIHLKIDPSQEQGNYANAVSVHINHNEVILDFGYNLPNQTPTTIKLVSRINLTHQSAESLLNVLSNGMLDWRNKKKEIQEKNNSK
jgi:hypothetical protein